MEIVIVICLLIVIALLVQDKIVIKKSSERKPIQEKSNPKLEKPVKLTTLFQCKLTTSFGAN